ncbi:hypothetical protein [Streptomyces longisporus]|uniref:hypothetical protein n=1 Tax=Streptomyces longisporus TaxID=1948 RepID=UPI0031E3B8A2
MLRGRTHWRQDLSEHGFAESLDWRPVRFAQQVSFHQGHEPSDRDRHDMTQLRRVFGTATHF